MTDKASEQEFSGLEGKALKAALREDFPSRKEIMDKIPRECFEKDTLRALTYTGISVSLTILCVQIGYFLIPMTLLAIPLWIAYALVTGTVVTGCWVLAHECGHGAFSDSVALRDTVGYILHTLLLVPYFSWQRSHAVHHSRTNHATEGETHVPSDANNKGNQGTYEAIEAIGEGPFAIFHAFGVLLVGWPMYILLGTSGGPVRGATNHFNPYAGARGEHELFPGKWKARVWLSDIGIFAFLGLLAYWAYKVGSVWPVMALYGGPYLVCNAWLVGYTWLQHTDVDVPHLGEDLWTWQKGAFMTIDRPYGALFDFLHHNIGSTHVVHHLNHQIPHYRARVATKAIAKAYPDLYLYDPTPVWRALLRVSGKCIGVVKQDGVWVYRGKNPKKAA
eukprot:CAMPEP_0118934932 /NCGR_PEP_ID=MMETSP1169-20130426/14519_1 /TAXON_ID=36882 /ORGANISM="Pyramimonas obovata, Strain CCMP722" /LENGTH=390 /DNA_ID=CAMNT_0006877895 /DNA_START=140 /DNA_END=1312 /DNA_ORIENTATION=-